MEKKAQTKKRGFVSKRDAYLREGVTRVLRNDEAFLRVLDIFYVRQLHENVEPSIDCDGAEIPAQRLKEITKNIPN